MARCPECNREIKLTLDTMVKPIDCIKCDRGPFRVKRTSGYIFALGLVAYFVFVIIFGVIILGVEPSSMFIYVHNSGSEGSFASLVFIGGFFLWAKVWGDIWSRKYAKLI